MQDLDNCSKELKDLCLVCGSDECSCETEIIFDIDPEWDGMLNMEDED